MQIFLSFLTVSMRITCSQLESCFRFNEVIIEASHFQTYIQIPASQMK